MRYFFGFLSLFLMIFFYKNPVVMFFLVYFALMLFPQTEKFIKKYFKLEMVEIAMAVFLLIYGPCWIVCKKLVRLRSKFFHFLLMFLQFFMRLFRQFDIKRS